MLEPFKPRELKALLGTSHRIKSIAAAHDLVAGAAPSVRDFDRGLVLPVARVPDRQSAPFCSCKRSSNPPIQTDRVRAESKVFLGSRNHRRGSGTGSQIDYQIFGLLGYKIKPKWTLQAGYRYLDVNYRSKTVYDAATSGIVLGVSISLK
jgi:hypothetical protein